MQNIIISGLTAAGKTTHSKRLAADFNLKYKSASNYLLEVTGINAEVSPGFWVSNEADSLQSIRKNDASIDRWVNQRLLDDTLSLNRTIFDSWALPWISKEPALRIWLESTLQTRIWKAMVSMASSNTMNLDNLREEIQRKDHFTRNLFIELYGFDIIKDHHVFDYIIDISSFLSEPTRQASELSIAKSHEIITAIVTHYFEKSQIAITSVNKLIESYGATIFVKVPSYFTL